MSNTALAQDTTSVAVLDSNAMDSTNVKAIAVSDSISMTTIAAVAITDSTNAIKEVESIVQTSSEVDAMIDYAKTFLGVPYRYGGVSPNGFDCSGFINYVMGDYVFSLTRTSYGLAELGKTVKLSEVQPGDLLFFKGRNVNSTSVGHVAMVVEVSEGRIMMIHASSSRGVVIDNFKTSKYYIPRFIKAKRMEYNVNAE